MVVVGYLFDGGWDVRGEFYWRMLVDIPSVYRLLNLAGHGTGPIVMLKIFSF